ncbi:hypothetical protein QFC21_003207, partial [Naganishia friedmannii]
MFRLLRDALASPTASAQSQPPRSSATLSKAGPSGERVNGSQGEAAVIDHDVVEVQKDAKDEDWEVKRVIQSIKLWNEEGERAHARDSLVLDNLLSQLETLISLPETKDHVTTPLADFPSTLRIRQTIFRTEGGFEVCLRVVRGLSDVKAGHSEDPQNVAMEGLKLEDSVDVAETSQDVEGSQQGQVVGTVTALSKVLSILHCCLSNERNSTYFHANGSWSAYEPALQTLSYPAQPEGSTYHPDIQETTSSDISIRLPDLQVLGLLWACACNQDKTLVTLFRQFASSLNTQDVDHPDGARIQDFPAPLPISSNLVLTNSHLLPIILNLSPLPYTATASSTCPSPTRREPLPLPLTESQQQLERLTYRILIAVVQSSWSNLFKAQKVLPSIYEAVLKRLYTSASRRREESKMAKSLDLEPALRKGAAAEKEKEQAFPKFSLSRYTDTASPGGTYTGVQNDDVFTSTTPQQRETNEAIHKPADETLRLILLKLLRRLVEAGVPVEYAYMLFRLAKRDDAPTALAKIQNIQAAEQGFSTQNDDPSSNESSPSKTPSGKRTKPAKPINLRLALNVLAGSAKNGAPVLDKDILEILRHGSSRRWPDMFMFSPNMGGSPGALSCPNLGKTWPTSAKGYYFMAWVYVEHLCGPITLLHVYEDKRTLLRVRILPNSQVGVIASRPESDQETLEEVIFSGSESLVPHQKWIHLALAGRRPRAPASSQTEVKLLINGRRTQALKSTYPKPTSMANLPGAEPVMASIGKDGRKVSVAEDGLDFDGLGLERSTWFLGHSMLLDEGATALNIYLHNMVYATKKEGKAVLPANSYLIKAIKQGNIFPEEQILFSYSANNVDLYHGPSQTPLEVPNAALPSPLRVTEPGRANAKVQGDVDVYNPMCLDEAMFAVGGPAVALKLAELASSPEELQSAISLLAECVKESWKASEEAERM